MDGAFGSRRRQRKPVINITSLIDVMFLLLIFFMVSSTFKEHLGIDITLPQAQSSQAHEEQPHEITLHADGRIFLEQRAMNPQGLREALKALLADDPQALLTLRADAAAPFQEVIRVMDIAREVGGKRLILPTQALTQDPPRSQP